MSKFISGDDQVDTERAFISDEISTISTSDLLAKLEELRTRRGARPKSVKKADKQEKEAKLLAELEQLVPPEHRALLAGLAPKEKKKVLMDIAKARLAAQAVATVEASKANEANEANEAKAAQAAQDSPENSLDDNSDGDTSA